MNLRVSVADNKVPKRTANRTTTCILELSVRRLVNCSMYAEPMLRSNGREFLIELSRLVRACSEQYTLPVFGQIIYVFEIFDVPVDRNHNCVVTISDILSIQN